jgi:hypothetical protein
MTEIPPEVTPDECPHENAIPDKTDGAFMSCPDCGITFYRKREVVQALAVEPASEEVPARSFTEFRELGLLWLVNRQVFHPRGYALAFNMGKDGEVLGWTILGDGSEAWTFASEEDEAGFKALESSGIFT